MTDKYTQMAEEWMNDLFEQDKGIDPDDLAALLRRVARDETNRWIERHEKRACESLEGYRIHRRGRLGGLDDSEAFAASFRESRDTIKALRSRAKELETE